MPSPLALIVPFGILLVGGGIAAAASKKKQQAGTPEGAAQAPAGTVAPSSPGAAATVAASGTIPADVQALIVAAITSQNPTTMRRAADQLQAKYPLQAADLRKAASDFEAAIAAAQAAGAGTAAAHQAAATAAQQIAAAAQAASQAANVPGSPVAVPSPQATGTGAAGAGQPNISATPPLSPMPTPTTTAPPVTASADRLRAASLVVALKTAKKGTASEPRAKVQEFQLVERLSRTDGSYGSETAVALADKYGIVPPKPLYWGKKGGTYATLVADKNGYKAHLLNLAAKDPQRGDEWRSAAQV